MCSLNLDPCDVWQETPVIARKEHVCDGCLATIAPGSPYVRHFDIFEGEPTSEKMCFACWWAREQFATAHGQHFAPSGLIEQLAECVGSNDDPDDVWRPVLAGVLARYRVASTFREQRRARWSTRIHRPTSSTRSTP